MGGSSAGIRMLLQSQELVNYMKENTHLNLEMYMKRGNHPSLSSTYINGYTKDLPLRNLSAADTLKHLSFLNQEFGRKPLSHNSKKVFSTTTSIQGQWVNDDKWNNFPKHLLESQVEILPSYHEPSPLKEVRDKKKVQDYYTRFMRKKF
tara:strand:- start:79 stop:525 length:447 start_codon:yes stop_codon:yes gene_type:complete